MSDALNLFPTRSAIGRTDTGAAVYQTAEFARALAGLMTRVGGTNGPNSDELAAEIIATAQQLTEQFNADLAATAKRVEDELNATIVATTDQLTQQIELAGLLVAQLAQLRKQVAASDNMLVPVAATLDWSRPGKIGARTPNSARFTTINGVGLTGTAAAALNIAGGGTLGAAAFVHAPPALAPVATDPATTMALANSMRSVLISLGLGA